jgi:hypothetical protein
MHKKNVDLVKARMEEHILGSASARSEMMRRRQTGKLWLRSLLCIPSFLSLQAICLKAFVFALTFMVAVQKLENSAKKTGDISLHIFLINLQ